MRWSACLVFLLGVLAMRISAASVPPIDNFDAAPIGSGGGAGWKPLDIGFAVRAGAHGREMVAEAPGGRGMTLWQAVPVARAVVLEATVTPRETTGHEWKTAGIGLFANADNFWHLAFVEAPDVQAKRHFVELSEMRDGVWNAQDEAASHLTTTEDSGPLTWRFGQSYRLRLRLERDRITGEIFEGETADGGRRVYRAVRLLDRPAVTLGRPMLSASNLTAAYDDLSANGVLAAAPKEQAKFNVVPVFPSFHWGSAKPVTTAKRDGFFRVQRRGQQWWLTDPQGRPTLAVGTDHVNFNDHWCEKLGYAPYHRNVEAKYGNEEAWADVAARRLRAWNFNTLGAGSSPKARYHGLAHTEFLSFGADFSSTAALVAKTTWTGWPDVFDPRWERFCDLRAAERCEPERADPWLLGYFLDNELEWWGKHGQKWGLAEETWRLSATSAGKQALVASLQRFYNADASAFNADFGTRLTDFEALASSLDPAQPLTERGQKALMEFVGEAARRYFQVTTAAVRRHDPGHLVLGCRFAHDAPDAAWRWAGRTCDIVSVNMYPRIDFARGHVVGLAEHLRPRFALCGKPMMLTEWGFPALDAHDTQGHPLPSQHGAGMRVDTQAQRARCYAIMQRDLFALPFIVGSDNFMWADEPALGVSAAFPEDSNYGLVSETDAPYTALTRTATLVNARVADIHAGRLPVPSPRAPGQAPVATGPASGSAPVFTRSRTGYTLQNDRLRLVKDGQGGDIFNHVFWRANAGSEWLELGRYGPLLVPVADGQNQYVGADRMTGVGVHEQGPRSVIDITFEKDAPQPFRGAYRLTLERGRSYFLARCLWVENPGPNPWHWHGYYHYTPSRLGGDAGDDVLGGPNVPNYWLPVGAWRDPGLRLDYGVLTVASDNRLSVNFWKDENGGQHPDCYRALDVTLLPGQRWAPTEPEPTVAVFGLRDTDAQPRPWTSLLPSLQIPIVAKKGKNH